MVAKKVPTSISITIKSVTKRFLFLRNATVRTPQNTSNIIRIHYIAFHARITLFTIS